MIQGLDKKRLADFSGGRVTSENQAVIPENCLLIASNILVHSGAAQPIAGYKKVQDTGLLGATRMWLYERPTDKKSLFVVTGPNNAGKYSIVVGSIDGAGGVQVLSDTEETDDFDFVDQLYGLYMYSSAGSYKLINIDGVETLLPIGLKAPISAPLLNVGRGDLLLQFGRRYVYCEVHRWKDSLGTARYHVSAPSDFSAHTGALGKSVADAAINTGTAALSSATAGFDPTDVNTSIVVAGAGPGGIDLITRIAAYTDASHVTLADNASTTVANAKIYFRRGAPALGGFTKRNNHTTHFWIFCTEDSEIDASGSYFFADEIPVAQEEWVDHLEDSELDTTREAPWDNLPPPESVSIAVKYQDRAVLIHEDKVQFSAFTETLLGSPADNYPTALKFRVPDGVRSITDARLFKIGTVQTLMLSTEDFWFQVNGADLDSFQRKDKIVAPGSVGKRASCEIHGRLAWYGKDKKVWSWTGMEGDEALPASASLHASSEDQLSMGDIDEALLSKIELHPYSNGTFDFAIGVLSSKHSESGEKDWVQMWDLSPVIGVKTVQGPMPAPAVTDLFPAHMFSTALAAKDAGISYIYFGDKDDGSIYRWPDGHQFDDVAIRAVIKTPWINLAPVKQQLLWVKLFTNVDQAKDRFRLFVNCAMGTNRTQAPVEVTLKDAPDGDRIDSTVAWATLNEPGLSIGNFIQLMIQFPEEDGNFAIDAIEVAFKPMMGV